MAYRECPTHGWLETAEYAVSPDGETMCPVCETALSGHYPDVGARRGIGGPNHAPRQRFVDAASDFMRRLDDLDDDEQYWDVKPVMSDYDFDG